MNKHENYLQMTVHINFLFCFLLHFKDGVNEVIILDGCMLFTKRPTLMCLADKKKKKKKKVCVHVCMCVRVCVHVWCVSVVCIIIHKHFF